MKILKNAFIIENDLDSIQKECFKEHHNTDKLVYILCSQGNLEYKIVNYNGTKYDLEFTGRILI